MTRVSAVSSLQFLIRTSIRARSASGGCPRLLPLPATYSAVPRQPAIQPVQPSSEQCHTQRSILPFPCTAAPWHPVDEREGLFQPIDVALGLLEGLLDREPEWRDACGLHHPRQCFDELIFGMQEIAHLLHEQAFDPVRLQRSVSGSIVDSRRLGTLSDGVCDLLESRSLHELEILVPRSARVDLSVFSLAVEVLKN